MSTIAHSLEDKRYRTCDVLSKENISFEVLLLKPLISKGLTLSGFKYPSPIQIKSIPLGRCGLDLIVQAKSGTGKTCVLAVVALEALKLEIPSIQVLVLAPTREVANQIRDCIRSIGQCLNSLQCHSYIGGQTVSGDRQTAHHCHIAVGSPGRIMDLIQKKIICTDSIRLFILDEADKLLEEGFQDQINWIYSILPSNKQMIALSATYPDALAKHVTTYMRNPTFVRLNDNNIALLGISQFYKTVTFDPVSSKVFDNKVACLLNLLSTITFRQCLVFSNYQTRAESLSHSLESRGWPTTVIAGSHTQDNRNKAMHKLKEFECRILVATDVCSRGVDAYNVNLVVNMDLPHDEETYMHRIGRAGRYGTEGMAVTFVSHDDELLKLQKIEKFSGSYIYPLPDEMPPDFINSHSNEAVTSSFTIINEPGVEPTNSKFMLDEISSTQKKKFKSNVCYDSPSSGETTTSCPLDCESQLVSVNNKVDESYLKANTVSLAESHSINHKHMFHSEASEPHSESHTPSFEPVSKPNTPNNDPVSKPNTPNNDHVNKPNTPNNDPVSNPNTPNNDPASKPNTPNDDPVSCECIESHTQSCEPYSELQKDSGVLFLEKSSGNCSVETANTAPPGVFDDVTYNTTLNYKTDGSSSDKIRHGLEGCLTEVGEFSSGTKSPDSMTTVDTSQFVRKHNEIKQHSIEYSDEFNDTKSAEGCLSKDCSKNELLNMYSDQTVASRNNVIEFPDPGSLSHVSKDTVQIEAPRDSSCPEVHGEIDNTLNSSEKISANYAQIGEEIFAQHNSTFHKTSQIIPDPSADIYKIHDQDCHEICKNHLQERLNNFNDNREKHNINQDELTQPNSKTSYHTKYSSTERNADMDRLHGLYNNRFSDNSPTNKEIDNEEVHLQIPPPWFEHSKQFRNTYNENIHEIEELTHCPIPEVIRNEYIFTIKNQFLKKINESGSTVTSQIERTLVNEKEAFRYMLNSKDTKDERDTHAIRDVDSCSDERNISRASISSGGLLEVNYIDDDVAGKFNEPCDDLDSNPDDGDASVPNNDTNRGSDANLNCQLLETSYKNSTREFHHENLNPQNNIVHGNSSVDPMHMKSIHASFRFVSSKNVCVVAGSDTSDDDASCRSDYDRIKSTSGSSTTSDDDSDVEDEYRCEDYETAHKARSWRDFRNHRGTSDSYACQQLLDFKSFQNYLMTLTRYQSSVAHHVSQHLYQRECQRWQQEAARYSRQIYSFYAKYYLHIWYLNNMINNV